MKKLVASVLLFVMIALMAFSMTACGGGNTDGAAGETDKEGNTKEITADSVILSVGYRPDPVATKGVHVIGDAKSVGNLRTVIWGAWDVAMKL